MTASGQVVLAKSRQQGKDVTLAEHTREVLTAVQTMFGTLDCPSRLAKRWWRFFRLPPEEHERFYRNLWLAAALHDVGKANDGFQGAVLHKRGGQSHPEVIRHEHLSALLVWHRSMRDWLQTHRAMGVDAEIVVSAVLSHHLKVNDKELAKKLSERSYVEVYAAAPDVESALAMAVEVVHDGPPDLAPAQGRWEMKRDIAPRREELHRAMYEFGRAMKRDERRRRLLLAVKAAVLAADSAGSAITRVDDDMAGWVRDAFSVPDLHPADIADKVIEPRIEQLRQAGRWQGFHDFQEAAAELGPRALLLSGCGSGKTLAAWRWIAAQLAHYEASRVLFLYPTRATATEGFRDYVSWAGPEEAALAHGTAQYDLEGMFANPGDPRSGGDFTVPERMFALGYWPKRVFSATVDTFLAFMSNRYAALCLVPLLADCVVVFDEVHSFDGQMFRALERFLKEFDVPALCMTASLPEDRLAVLERSCGLKRFPSDSGQFADLREQAEADRYRVTWIAAEEALGIALKAVKGGNAKVLWVLNTVARCQAAARALRCALRKELGQDGAVLCYHSRFRLVDRKGRHERAMAEFRDQTRPTVLVTTQVCEMSLDLDADVLISEAAAVPSMIQRMGRCCRVPLPGERRGEVYLYMPEAPAPYEPYEIADGEAFGRALAQQGAVSHAGLAAYLSRLEVREPVIESGFTGFLDSGGYAMARDDSFREDDDFAVDGVLDGDLTAFLAAQQQRRGAAAGFIVPVPRRCGTRNAALGRYVYLARSDHYSCRYGYVADEVPTDD